MCISSSLGDNRWNIHVFCLKTFEECVDSLLNFVLVESLCLSISLGDELGVYCSSHLVKYFLVICKISYKSLNSVSFYS
jgi:hypothetical protein